MHKKLIKMSIICALCICVFNVKNVYAQDVKVGTHLEHEYEISVVRRAGEHTDGERLYKCKICGESHVETIEATGHVWGAWIVDVDPTKTKEGHRYRVCTKYPDHPHYQEEVIPPLSEKSKSSNPSQKANGAIKKDNKAYNTDKKDLQKDTVSQENVNKRVDISETSSKQVLEEENSASDDRVVDQAGIKAANIGADTAVALYAGVNILDVFAGLGAIALSWWYAIVLKPMVAALMWIKRKRNEIEKKLYSKK